MHDQSPARIQIGGRIKRSDVPILQQALEDTPVEVNGEPWEGCVEDFDDSVGIELESSCRSGGEFGTIEAVCHQLGLSYNRYREPCSTYDGSIVFWRPWMGELARFVNASINGPDHKFVDHSDLAAQVEKAENLCWHVRGILDMAQERYNHAVIAEAADALDEHMAEFFGEFFKWAQGLPVLPRFKIVDG